jgi:hypothetical protein
MIKHEKGPILFYSHLAGKQSFVCVRMQGAMYTERQLSQVVHARNANVNKVLCGGYGDHNRLSMGSACGAQKRARMFLLLSEH